MEEIIIVCEMILRFLIEGQALPSGSESLITMGSKMTAGCKALMPGCGRGLLSSLSLKTMTSSPEEAVNPRWRSTARFTNVNSAEVL